MAKIGLPKGSGNRLKVREKSVKSQGILKWILSGNPAMNPDQTAPWEQSDLGPYCLQCRLPKNVNGQESRRQKS